MNQIATHLRFIESAQLGVSTAGLGRCYRSEVAIVCFDTASWGQFEPDAIALLDARERERAARFRFDRDRCTYVLAHAMWRVVLGILLDLAPSEIPLQFRATGQPQLPGTGMATSLSHSGPVVLIAVGKVEALGIDVERWPPRVSLASLSAVICTPEEEGASHVLSAREREYNLMQLWTRKEALLKAWGCGLGQAPASFPAANGAIVAPPRGLDGVACRVIDLALAGDQVGALAASREMTQFRMHVVSGHA